MPTETAGHEKEVGYGEFFDRVIEAGGNESVVALNDRKDEIRVKHARA
ncbi:MAG: hypothetical protein OXQ89_10300 [Rhodospirillaceae bacterium]|nr:hypothetical protein [Rhodospirillaceae bacterium]